MCKNGKYKVEKHREKNIHDISPGNDLMNIISKAQIVKPKIYK